MENEKIIDFLLTLDKGLTQNEKTKAKDAYDAIYFEEKIAEHHKKAKYQRSYHFAILITAIVASISLLGGKWIDPEILGWLKGINIGLLIGIGFMLPTAYRNHQRIVLILKTISEMRKEKENNLVDAK